MSKTERRAPDDLEAVAALVEPVRRRLYEYVASADGPVGREEASSALGIGRPLAAFHLDRLVRDGLLVTEYRRLGGRSGPGSGRPAKLYRRAAASISISLPPRDYALAAGVFADAIERLGPAGSADAVLDAARDRGLRLGQAAAAGPPDEGSDVAALVATLDELGFEPRTDGDVIRLRNCPFDRLAQEHRDLTCPANLALLDGLIAGLGATAQARAWPEPGYCCVAVECLTASVPDRGPTGIDTDP